MEQCCSAAQWTLVGAQIRTVVGSYLWGNDPLFKKEIHFNVFSRTVEDHLFLLTDFIQWYKAFSVVFSLYHLNLRWRL